MEQWIFFKGKIPEETLNRRAVIVDYIELFVFERGCLEYGIMHTETHRQSRVNETSSN